jgi:broad specificity phosphatase PhoE
MKKTLVLVRHAHRDTAVRSKDNGLSEKGKEQARWVKKFFTARFGKDQPGSIWLVSSPKKRCQETLALIAAEIKQQVDPHPDLDEQSNQESVAKFEERVNHFIKDWMDSPQELTIACSHGDWLPVAIARLLGCHADFKKSSWLEIEYDGSMQLKWFVPTLKPFYG